ncbi:hypothetical protein [Nocardia vermiculata]|uniref:Uncharacterized protein n=1 Tax=Nocardia vermiculata TaxID=257274 RepID=A0A846XU85_9NOCA|nr:hypothetical protein [Nocardia vermiculata]NKY49592.1 hypothetical protein [Nocardia vermiculata]
MVLITAVAHACCSAGGYQTRTAVTAVQPIKEISEIAKLVTLDRAQRKLIIDGEKIPGACRPGGQCQRRRQEPQRDRDNPRR